MGSVPTMPIVRLGDHWLQGMRDGHAAGWGEQACARQLTEREAKQVLALYPSATIERQAAPEQLELGGALNGMVIAATGPNTPTP
jgi:hypothetical protein